MPHGELARCLPSVEAATDPRRWDLCACGDFRMDHDNGKRCRVCNGSLKVEHHCREFRLSHRAEVNR